MLSKKCCPTYLLLAIYKYTRYIICQNMPANACTDAIEDIEDLFRNAEKEASLGRQYVYPKIRKTTKYSSIDVNAVSCPAPVISDSIIPGTHCIFVKTWGCTHNTSDSEYMSGQLAAYGYRITDNKEEADLWLLNSCTVKNPAEDHFRNEIEAAKSTGKHVVLAGCVAQSVPATSYLKGLSIIGVQQIDRVVEVVEETLKGHMVRLLGKKKLNGRKTGGASLDLPKIRRNSLIEIIAISTGCLNHCTYCKTKHARGELGSYLVDAIVERAKQAFQEGVVELWVTSEDTGAYGRDIGSSLPQLLWRLIDVVPDGCMLRVGMTNPPYILEHLEEMSRILAHPKVYAFLHIPVQSGSDPVLADMKREYCRADFENMVDFLKERVPGLTIATDIICGFPTETEKDFEESLDLVRKYRFPSLFINQFFPRPGTPAAKMPKIPTQAVKKRTKSMSELFASYKPYDHKVGRVERVLVTESSSDNTHFIGHNKFYEQVLVPNVPAYMGHWVTVQIASTGKHYLMGQPLTSTTLMNANATSRKNLGKASQNSYAVFMFAAILIGWVLHKLLAIWHLL